MRSKKRHRALGSQSEVSSQSANARASIELALVQAQVAAARADLVLLLQEVAEAESRLASSKASQMLEANEQLVVAALRAQGDAATTALALDEALHSAHLDALTRLPNRLLLLDRFALAIASAKRHGNRIALFFLDLDNFKHINDSLGHAVGDEVLKWVTRGLSASCRAGDTVSRHGGDEFLILLPDVPLARDAALIAEKVLAAIGAPFKVGEHLLTLAASIGISFYPEDGQDPARLIERADTAMYCAKKLKRGSFVFYGDELPEADPGARSPSTHDAQSEACTTPPHTPTASGP